MQRASVLFDWLVDGAPGANTASEVIERMGRDLRTAGVLVDRMGVFVKTLHPTVIGRAFYWEPNHPVKVLDMTLDLQRSPSVQDSPVAQVSSSKVELRRSLTAALAKNDYGIMHELHSEGFTDYLCLPIVFLRGETHAVTFATKSPEGFSDNDLAYLRHVVRPLARVTEIFALHRTAANLLSTYVGRNSGERILAGRIFKGDIETIRAVIWFSDLRGFTERSAKQTPRETIDMLNLLFDCQVPTIEKHGGEVLKFIGDGLMAIFPLDAGHTADAAAEAALDSADEAFAALAKKNEGVAHPTQFGLALHIGEFAYGNIGGASRLDFTAIGAAVNITARLEGLTSKLGRRLVVSAELAKHVKRALLDLGPFDLKGVPEKQNVFAPA
jgi:adenylate cyclase